MSNASRAIDEVARVGMGRPSTAAALSAITELLGDRGSPPQQTLRAVLSVLQRELGLSRWALHLPGSALNVLSVECSSGLQDNECARMAYVPGEGAIGQVVIARQPLVLPRAASDPRFVTPSRTRAVERYTCAFVCVPIVERRRVLGTLSADAPRSRCRALDSLLDALSRLASLLVPIVCERIRQRESQQNEGRMTFDPRLEHSLGALLLQQQGSLGAAYSAAARAAREGRGVLLQGEPGTGKQLFARAVHQMSEHCDAPIELVGGSEPLGELNRTRACALYFDEIAGLAPASQHKLAALLSAQAAGQGGPHILAATNHDLASEVRRGRFCEDLYVQLSRRSVQLPALRHRPQDIAQLARHALVAAGREQGLRDARIDPFALARLEAHDFPRNHWELAESMRQAAETMAKDQSPWLRVEHLPLAISGARKRVAS